MPNPYPYLNVPIGPNELFDIDECVVEGYGTEIRIEPYLIKCEHRFENGGLILIIPSRWSKLIYPDRQPNNVVPLETMRLT